MLSRRDFHASALGALLAAPHRDWLRRSATRVLDTAGRAVAEILIRREWKGEICRSTLRNSGSQPVRLKELILFETEHSLPASTRIYGEGFQMLSQTGGAIGQPVQLGGYTDLKHYKLSEPGDAVTVYNVLWLGPETSPGLLLGFTSSRRFSGRFHLRASSLQVTVDLEGLELAPGQEWMMEEFCLLTGAERPLLFDRFAALIGKNHPRLAWPAPPEGWCSWYCFGPRVTAQQVRGNLAWSAANAPNLRYIQIDDGYQPAMGDWLETGAAFGGEVKAVLQEIRQRSFEPAIWVAPFIAEDKSQLFSRHPEWFMKSGDGTPLASNKVTFGGWRRGPWYALDATQPAVRAHLTSVFATMNREWGVTYFKLDANFWGAMHGARLADPKTTRIEAYRLGMKAILEGAGRSFVLGCNHPMWPSLGLIHGSRSSGDISRRWSTVKKVASENLHRAWQNGRLWWNDPDAVVLLGNLPENEFMFHAAATFATGGMLLSGDDLTKMTPERKSLLMKLRPTGQAAAFDPEWKVGRMKLKGREYVVLLNWEETPATIEFTLARPTRLSDYLSGEDLGPHRGRYVLHQMAPRSGRVLHLHA